ncbi:hypothetical protein [Paenibacillus sp. HJGM_3]
MSKAMVSEIASQVGFDYTLPLNRKSILNGLGEKSDGGGDGKAK